jgi:hypothetical protein
MTGDHGGGNGPFSHGLDFQERVAQFKQLDGKLGGDIVLEPHIFPRPCQVLGQPYQIAVCVYSKTGFFQPLGEPYFVIHYYLMFVAVREHAVPECSELRGVGYRFPENQEVTLYMRLQLKAFGNAPEIATPVGHFLKDGSHLSNWTIDTRIHEHNLVILPATNLLQSRLPHAEIVTDIVVNLNMAAYRTQFGYFFLGNGRIGNKYNGSTKHCHGIEGVFHKRFDFSIFIEMCIAQ